MEQLRRTAICLAIDVTLAIALISRRRTEVDQEAWCGASPAASAFT